MSKNNTISYLYLFVAININMSTTIRFITILLVGLLLLGCTSNQPAAPPNVSMNNSSTGVNMSKNSIVVFETTKGTFKAEIFEKEAPISAKNFLGLVRSGFYNNLTFHRYEPDFVIQGGDPKGDGSGGSGKTIPLEIVPGLSHDVGALGMARTNDPNSATSQFYVVVGNAKFLDGQYAVFGKVTSGMDVANQLRKGDRMTKVYVE
jgi:peptidyl-prolyl cis-trans isomerase B (cyclophilin B)